MPDAAAAPAQGQEAQSSSTTKTIKQVLKSIAIFVFMQFAIRQFMSAQSKDKAPPPPGSTPDQSVADTASAPGEYSQIPQVIYPLWPSNISIDFAIYVSPSVAMPALSKMPQQSLIVSESNFSLAGNDKRDIGTTFAVPKQVQNNGTLWAHMYVAQAGYVMDPSESRYDPQKAYRITRPLTQYLTKKKHRRTRNLLEAKNDSVQDVEPEEYQHTGPLVGSFYHPNFTVSFIPDAGTQQYPSLHPAVRQFYALEQTDARDATGQNTWYYPILYLNTFWQLRTHMYELNASNPIQTLPINIHIATMPNWQFSLMASVDEGMKETARKAAAGEAGPGGGDGSEMEMLKSILLDSNIYLLATTFVVSIFHMIFEMLAFKSDVSHWRKKKDNVGTSVRTILANVFMQSVIFLYLLDNNESTSWMILFGQGTGIAIEFWKITKTVNVRLREPQPGRWYSFLPIVVVFEDKHTLSETEEKTEEYDRIAFNYMAILAVPLLGGYAVYSLLYDSHKSWYSFIITTLVGSVYAYGFLMMVPSLYINYRLKSVAHLPAKAMTYKFLNTFIDDLFAFTIKMPTLHRLATLRDDVIFFVYLYQAWAYKVDFSRVNEFGQGGDDEQLEEKVANKPLRAPAGADGSVKEGKDIKSPEIKVNVDVHKGGEDGAVSSGKDKGGGRKRKG